MKDIIRKFNIMFDLSKFTSNKKIGDFVAIANKLACRQTLFF